LRTQRISDGGLRQWCEGARDRVDDEAGRVVQEHVAAGGRVQVDRAGDAGDQIVGM